MTDDPLFSHDPTLATRPYDLGGQLAWARLDDHVDALVAAGEAPDGQCGQCRLKCCTYAIAVPHSEIGGITDAAARLGIGRQAMFRVADASDMVGTRTLARREDGHCLFFDASERCRIHGAAGPDAKPSVCQLYPGQPVVTPVGARVAVRPECPWPLRTRDPKAVGRYQRVLGRRTGIMPGLLVRVVPDRLRIDAAVSAPFAAFDTWLGEAVALVLAADTAMAGLDRAVEALVARFALTSPPIDGLRARTLAAALSGVLDASKAPAAAEAMVRVACATPTHDPRPTSRALVVAALESFEPLRFPTLLAGLGVLRLFVAACDRDARSLAAPNEVLAGYFRQLHHDMVRLPLACATILTLETMACDRSL